MSSDSRNAARPAARCLASARVASAFLGEQIAGDALVEASVAEIGDVERDHPPRDIEAAAQGLRQQLEIADAVLEADDQRAVRPCGGDVARRVGRGPLLTPGR